MDSQRIATTDEIAEFKLAAAKRYAELNVPADVAEQLFNAQLEKISAELGLKLAGEKEVTEKGKLDADEPAVQAEKKPAVTAKAKASPESQDKPEDKVKSAAKVDALSTKIASLLHRTRKSV